MRRSLLTVVPFFCLASFLDPAPASAANQQGDWGIATNIGFAYPRADHSYSSDQTLNFALEYQKTGYAAYRATAGFLTIAGSEPISPAAGKRNADALYVAGNIVFTPRFAVVHPLFTAGVGVYSFRMSDNLGTEHSAELGFNWGVGMDIQLLRHFALRGEYTLHYTTGNVSSPITTFTIGGHFLF